MIAALLFVVEVLASCHCRTWVVTERGPRCAVVVQRCELVQGWHLAAPGVPTCHAGCGPDDGVSG